MNLDALLSRAVDLGASDIHLKLGRPPMLRRDGSLGPIEGPDLTEADLEVVLQRVTESAPQRLKDFATTGDLDIAYQSGELPRFRVNGFRQRGAISFAFRVIPKRVPNFVSSVGAFSDAEIASPSRRRVSAGSTTPSSHRRALA